MMTLVPYSRLLLLVSICLFALMYASVRPLRIYPNALNNSCPKRTCLFFFFFIISNFFAFWAQDTYHYWSYFVIGGYEQSITSYEGFYNWLADICGYDYFLWRGAIFIPASIIMYRVGKRLHILNRNFLLALFLLASLLSYSRAMLGHCLLLLALVLLIDEESKKSEKIWGLVLFACSYFLHRSMFVNMLFALAALLPLNRKTLSLSLIAFPFLVSLVTIIIGSIATGAWDTSALETGGADGDSSISNYAGQKQVQKTFYGYLAFFIVMIPQYMALMYSIHRITIKKYLRGMPQERIYTYLCKLSYVAIYAASLFIFVDTSSWIYDRFKYMGLFPLPFVLARLWSMESRSCLWVKGIIWLQMLAIAYELSHRILLYK